MIADDMLGLIKGGLSSVNMPVKADDVPRIIWGRLRSANLPTICNA